VVVSTTYSNVDGSDDPVAAVEWQERVNRWPAIRNYKRRSHELLGPARRIVDIGCGPGDDVAELGADRCIGVDASVTMARRSRGRGADVCVADAHSLPFGDGSFDGARADRVFQHLADPQRALREMRRVVVPGGRLVIADPDQSTLVIEVPGVRRDVLDRLERLRRDVLYRNGTLIAELPRQLRTMGFRDVTVESFPLVLTDPADAFGLPTWPEACRREGAFTPAEIAEWNDAISERPVTGFVYSVSYDVVAATRP
jgi:ubiquinone/menaquinone biosynthesis C-methylase UbiE